MKRVSTVATAALVCLTLFAPAQAWDPPATTQVREAPYDRGLVCSEGREYSVSVGGSYLFPAWLEWYDDSRCDSNSPGATAAREGRLQVGGLAASSASVSVCPFSWPCLFSPRYVSTRSRADIAAFTYADFVSDRSGTVDVTAHISGVSATGACLAILDASGAEVAPPRCVDEAMFDRGISLTGPVTQGQVISVRVGISALYPDPAVPASVLVGRITFTVT